MAMTMMCTFIPFQTVSRLKVVYFGICTLRFGALFFRERTTTPTGSMSDTVLEAGLKRLHEELIVSCNMNKPNMLEARNNGSRHQPTDSWLPPRKAHTRCAECQTLTMLDAQMS